MTEDVSRSLADQLVRVGLFLILFSAGIIQLFFIAAVDRHLRQHLGRAYERFPILLKIFGPPLKNTRLKGYTVAKRIGGVILIIISFVFLISAFQPRNPCDDHYWSITRRDPC
jgi:hypothetical protein